MLAFTAVAASATEFHVAITGSDAGPGTQAAPLRTIQRAADLARRLEGLASLWGMEPA